MIATKKMGLEFKQLLKGFDWKISLGFDKNYISNLGLDQ